MRGRVRRRRRRIAKYAPPDAAKDRRDGTRRRAAGWHNGGSAPPAAAVPPNRSPDARQLVLALAWLRVCAVVGQLSTVLVVAFALRVPIPVPALLGGIGVLAAFGALAFWRLHQSRGFGSIEAVAHVAVDIGVLGYLLYLTGGATNPFVSLLVMPITLAAAALRLRHVAVVATLATATYLVLMRFHLPLASVHPQSPSAAFDLHIVGMALSFAITAALLCFFIARLAAALRAQQAEAEQERERALRDEGILAIATQAAGAAHELNTPLSTIRTLLAELRREQPADSALGADLALLSGQAERCRDILREMVAVGRNHLAGVAQRTTLGAFVADCLHSFALLRPEIEVVDAAPGALAQRSVQIAPAVRHALLNLLNNAADASLGSGEARIELGIAEHAGMVELRVRDFGPGLASPVQGVAGAGFLSSKRDGLGLGLALVNATAERLGGELVAQRPDGGGTLQRLRLPLIIHETPPRSVTP